MYPSSPNPRPRCRPGAARAILSLLLAAVGPAALGQAVVGQARTARSAPDRPDRSTPAQPGRTTWALQPIRRPEPPAVAAGPFVRNPIDRFVLARLGQRGLTPSPPADRISLVRRLSLVVRGLPPAPGEIDRFLADRRPDALERLADAMLASPRYGERWASHWLDVVGFAETNGFETNTPRRDAYHYRDWVIDAFNRDLPYVRFVRDQLAGDAFGIDAATGFLVAGPYDTVKSPDVVLTRTQRHDELADMVDRASTAFLGLTVACARCHDHKFDPISQRDFYGMEAVFAGVRHGERALRPRDHREREAEAVALEARIAELEARLGELPVRPPPTPAAALWIDDVAGEQVRVLRKPAGYGHNPPGRGRGFRDDPGDLRRGPNLGSGAYTWWNRVAGQDLIAYRPGRSGRYRIWLSWGCGHHTHATDARYLLDADGDLATRGDQRELARVDQQRFAPAAPGAPPPGGELPEKPLWSGLLDAGVHELGAATRVVLRAGDSDRPVTADAVVFEPVLDDPGPESGGAATPRLRPAVRFTRNEERFAPVPARYLRFTVQATNNGIEPCLDELEVFAAGGDRNVARTAVRVTSSGDYQGDPKHRLAHVNDGRFGNEHSWISNRRGSGCVELEFPAAVVIDRVAWGRDRNGRYRDRLPTRYRIEVAAEPGAWREVAGSGSRAPRGVDAARAPAWRFAGLAEAAARRAQAWLEEVDRARERIGGLRRAPQAWLGRFEKPEPTHLLHRGDPMAPREVVAPAAPGALQFLGELRGAEGAVLTADAPEQERRLALARWITAPGHPLTARVIVNRIWQHHFGEGLVDTPSDFGAMGSPPSHPLLLDWLASELIDSGWSLKHVQRLILGSGTWRQASRPRPEGLAVDAASRLLWRFPPRRLAAEVIRDAVLAVAGTLDLAAGGPGFEVFEPNSNYVRVYEPMRVFGAAQWRRAVYMRKVRMEQDATFGAFDCPDAGQGCAKRTRSITALQALGLLNSPFMVQQGELFAARLGKQAGPDPADRVRLGFRLAFGRRPAAAELRAGVDLARTHGLPALCRALLNANEFLFLP